MPIDVIVIVVIFMSLSSARYTRLPSRLFRSLYTTTPAQRTLQHRKMSGKPQILGSEELKTDAKWLKLERTKWKDEEGKEVGLVPFFRHGMG